MLKKKKKDWCDKKGKVGWGDGFEQCSDIMDLTFLDCWFVKKISKRAEEEVGERVSWHPRHVSEWWLGPKVMADKSKPS